MHKFLKKIPKVCLLFLLIFVGLILLTYKLPWVSATYDEGFSYLSNGGYLVRHFRWDVPYILLHPPLSYYLHGWTSLVFQTNNVNEQLLIARLAMLPIYLIFAFCIFQLVKRWYGKWAAFGSLVLYLFNPEILSHARFITPDHLLTFCIFMTLMSFYTFLKRNTFWRFLVAGVFLGLTLLSKYNGLLLFPLLMFLGCLYSLNNKAQLRPIITGIAGMFLIAILMVHLGYLFQETGKIPDKFVSSAMQKITQNSFMKTALIVVFPRAYLLGMDFQMYESSKGVWWGYFKGNYYNSGLWYFYPVVFLIKTPLPLLILLALTIILSILKKINTKPFVFTLVFISISWFFLYMMFFNKLIIGLRYLLMVYPLLIIIVAPLFIYNSRIKVFNFIYRGMLVILLIWYVWGSVKVAPFYLAFANESIGGPKNLWKYVADSSLDWNQDQLFFSKYRDEHPELNVINPRKPTAGLFAVNVNEMNLFYYYQYQWLRNLHKEPIEQIGYTWLIFMVTPEELKGISQ